jgi:hypothetical protein
MSIDGISKLTRLSLVKLELDFIKDPTETHVVIALTDPVLGTKSRLTFGGNVWSEETTALIRQVIQSLEQDVARVVFEGGTDVPDAPGKPTAKRREAPAGLGEFLSDDGVASF